MTQMNLLTVTHYKTMFKISWLTEPMESDNLNQNVADLYLIDMVDAFGSGDLSVGSLHNK